MRIAYIHDDRKIYTGAHHINELIICKLREFGAYVKNFYPRTRLIDGTHHDLKGVSNILFFYSLLEQKKEILKYDLIQGTTFTPITFLAFNIPVITHFGSTTIGILESIPMTKDLDRKSRNIFYKLKRDKIINEINLRSRKPLIDVSNIQFFTAKKSTKVIAASKIVKNELIKYGNVPPNNILVIHNAIEDYWFEKPLSNLNKPKLLFLGRIGNNAFTWKTKGLDRLINIYQEFPNLYKVSIIMTKNKKIAPWINKQITNHKSIVNLQKEKIYEIIHSYRGSVSLLTSRYEGFSLSLVETMSQGLIPISFPVGVAPEIIVNGKNGYLVNSTKEACFRIKEIMKNEQLRGELSYSAYRTSLQFKADILAKKLVSLYKSIISNKKST